MRPKKFNNKGKKRAGANTQHFLGSDLGDETKVTTMGLKCKECITSIGFSNILYETQNEKERMELFHIRVISKHNEIDTLLIVDHKKTSFERPLSRNLIWNHSSS